MPSHLRRFACELVGALVRLAAYLAALAALAAGVLYFLPQFIPVSTGVAAVPTDPQADWLDVARPYPAFALVMSEFEGSETHYLIRRHLLGGRKDVIGFGSAGGQGAHLRIEIYRAGGEQERFADAKTEIAARVADLDPAGMKGAGTLDTKLGRFSLVEFAAHPAGGPRQCLGFARVFPEPPVQIAGTYCRAGPAMIERGVLTCALDRLTLTAGGTEPKLAELFAEAEVKRNFCGHNGPILAATPKRATWIESAREPKLRGRLAAQ